MKRQVRGEWTECTLEESPYRSWSLHFEDWCIMLWTQTKRNDGKYAFSGAGVGGKIEAGTPEQAQDEAVVRVMQALKRSLSDVGMYVRRRKGG